MLTTRTLLKTHALHNPWPSALSAPPPPSPDIAAQQDTSRSAWDNPHHQHLPNSSTNSLWKYNRHQCSSALGETRARRHESTEWRRGWWKVRQCPEWISRINHHGGSVNGRPLSLAPQPDCLSLCCFCFCADEKLWGWAASSKCKSRGPYSAAPRLTSLNISTGPVAAAPVQSS